MSRIIKFILFTLVGFVVLNTSISAQQNTYKTSKTPNISLNASGTDGQSTISYLNIGLLTNIQQLRGLGVNLFSSNMRQKMDGIQVSGTANITGYEANGIQIAGITNVARLNSKGIHIGGLMNIAGNKMSGLHLSVLGNIAARNLQGLSIGGLINMTGGTANVFEIAGLANFTGKQQNGIALSGLLNVSGEGMKGIQTAGLMNISANKAKGIQIAGLGNIAINPQGLQLASLSNIASDTLKGMQIGLTNYASQLSGAQVGIVNLSGNDVKGVQIGVVNQSKDSTSLKIGLINISPITRVQVLTYGGTLSKINVAVRIRNHSLYTILGVGTHYLGLDEKFSGTMFFRAGTIYDLTNKLAISGDLGFYHIETFNNKGADIPKRMYSIQPRLNMEYAISSKFGLFVSGGYSWTRHYNKNMSYENKPLFELGMILF